MKSGKTKRRIAALVLILLLAVGQAGCSMLKSGIHDLHGSIFGNEYNIDICDNMGIRTLRTHGEKIDIVARQILKEYKPAFLELAKSGHGDDLDKDQ